MRDREKSWSSLVEVYESYIGPIGKLLSLLHIGKNYAARAWNVWLLG